MKNKKTLIICIVAIVALVCITVGISLAFFNYAGAGTTDNTIETGSITFLYTETSSVGRGIAIEDAFPISNSEGKLLTGEGNVFDFNISSETTSNTNIPFEITARKNNNSTLSEDVVVMYLTKVNGVNEEEILLDKYSNLSQTEKINSYTEKVLYTGTVYSDTEYDQDYRLRMWITNDGTFESEDMGKTFTVTVNVYSNATVVTESEKALENNNNLTSVSVNNNELTKIENKSYDYEAKLEEGTTSATLNVETEVPNAKVKVEKINNLAKSNSITKLSTQITLSDLVEGTNLYKVTVTSANEKVIDEYILKIKVGNTCDYDEGDSWNFDYTGGEQTFTVPNKCSGTYKLETWGAQGGNASEVYYGGYGTYSIGNLSMNQSDKLFINVGGKGIVASNTTKTGGYNGGGGCQTQSTADICGTGGGATHISKVSGLLKNLSSNKSNIYIVSGGGGGSYNYIAFNSIGGNAGGVNGEIAPTGTCTDRLMIFGTQATQTSGGTINQCIPSNESKRVRNGSFGKGADGVNWESGGGAGYYGGGAGFAHGANGGSSYIGNPLLQDKSMYCYGCTESNEESTKTVSTTCHSSTPTEKCAKEGNGYARITLVSLSN